MNLMDWSKCEKEFIRKVTPDQEKICSIVEMAMSRLEFVKSHTATEKNVYFIVEGYYEILKELLVALLLKNGLKSRNHQCLITYFYREYPDHEFEANLISRMSYLRNRLDYYGEAIDVSFYSKNKEDIEKIIGLLASIVND
ncbi:hypothetical protein HQ545_01525 [Candidatus Woesearchaeota archaeon]|nr:hypothetical protein [Candidatus Woesearchaeota archaeon]